MIVLQLLVLFWILIVMPTLIGHVINKSNKDILNGWGSGTLVMLSIYMILALIVTFSKGSLSILSYLWALIVMVIAMLGVYKLKGFNYDKPKVNMIWIAVLGLVLLQIVAVIVLRHSDADDAWYVATASTDWYTNTVGQIDPYTGEPLPWYGQSDYMMAPWPVFIATLAKFSGIHPAIIFHTVIPAYVVLAFYVAMHGISKILFSEEKKRGIFMIALNLLVLFGNFSRRSSANLLLQRGWQGKAIMASIIIPLIFALVYKYMKGKNKYNYVMILSGIMVGAMCSSMCTILSSGVIAAYCLAGLLKKEKIKDLFILALTVVPNVIIVLLKFMITRGIIC